MAMLANLVVAATTLLAAPALPEPSAIDAAAVAHLAFSVDIATFVAARIAQAPAALDWSSDGCTTPLPFGLGNTGRSYDFGAACWRHDFGYRNHKLLDRRPGEHGRWWNERVRKRIDDRFLADMRADCAPRPVTQRASCRAWASTYYRAVRLAGGR
jgi:Prokaryotic phospholipase A2